MISTGAQTLYILRHGETESNVQRRMQGSRRDTALTTLGREQARTVAGILKCNEPDPSRLAFVSSPLMRARTTMEIILGELALPSKIYLRDDRLMEIDCGDWDGLTFLEARDRDPQTFDHRATDKWNIRIPNGENYSGVATRVESWVRDLRTHTLAVSHGGLLRILRGLFLGLSVQQMSDLDEPQGVVFRVCGSAVERLEAP